MDEVEEIENSLEYVLFVNENLQVHIHVLLACTVDVRSHTYINYA